MRKKYGGYYVDLYMIVYKDQGEKNTRVNKIAEKNEIIPVESLIRGQRLQWLGYIWQTNEDDINYKQSDSLY